MAPIIRRKRRFWTHHLTAAAVNARKVKKIEEFAKDKDLTDKVKGKEIRSWHRIHDSLIISSIISSFSTLEVDIHEFIKDIIEGLLMPQKLEEKLIKTVRFYLLIYPGGTKRFLYEKKTLEKYQLLLRSTGKEPFTKGKEPYQSIKIVKDLRNYFVHLQRVNVS